MDRHGKWLRRRIVASIATQTAETFAVAAVLTFIVIQWRTDEGPLTALFGSVVVAQIIAGARLGHAMRNNPLNYVFMRRYVDQPFSYSVARFHGEEEAHPVAEQLPGFAPVATIRDRNADPEPVFDVYHDPSRLVAASVSRASGAVSLISSLADGRLLVTDARLMPPHERLVMGLADDDSLEAVIATHRRAISARSDVVELASSAHQVVLDSLALEYDAYVSLGPMLSPFLDLEPQGKSRLRLVARIKRDELVELPTRLGPDRPAPASASPPSAQDAVVNEVAVPAKPSVQRDVTAPGANPIPEPVGPPALRVPQVIAPQIMAPPVAAPTMPEPQMVDVVAAAPVAEAPVAGAPEPQMVDVVAAVPVAAAPVVEAPEPPMVGVVADVPVVGDLASPDVPALLPPTANIAPPAFTTVEPDPPDLDATREPVTAEVPVVAVQPASPPTSAPPAEVPAVAKTSPIADTPTPPPAPAEAPLDLAAAIASLSTVSSIEPVAKPVVAESVGMVSHADPVVPVAAKPVVAEPVGVVSHAEPVAAAAVAEPVGVVSRTEPALAEAVAMVSIDVPEFVYEPPISNEAPARPPSPVPTPLAGHASEAPLPDFILQAPPASLAEAVVPAPDTAASLASPDDEPMLVANLGAALGRSEELSPTRPRLSAVIRANSAPHAAAQSGRRSRRKR